ncbi:MAG: hypothetical protein ACR2RV_26215 [Verrucomicrobiales bacterium]
MDEPANEDKPKPVAEGGAAAVPAETEAVQAKKKLTPEEQMAAYEKAMKEEDWGHQPC